MSVSNRVYRRLYRSASDPEELPWSHTDPTDYVSEAINQRATPGRALDVGCGTGTDTVFLASLGWAVTGVDFVADALAMARERANKANVSPTFIQADVTTWTTDTPFDLIVDRGCLHNFKDKDRLSYRDRLYQWLAPGGDYVLVHFNKRHVFDWRPIGPRRFPASEILAFFEEELIEQSYKTVNNLHVPLPIGPAISVNTFWFKRKVQSNTETSSA